MTQDEQEKPSQRQDSRQSAGQGADQKSTGKPAPGKQDQPGIGASQGQDRGSPSEQQESRPSAGTPDIERGSARDTGPDAAGSTESLVKDPTGAFKERP
jgi:hypothetical protein